MCAVSDAAWHARLRPKPLPSFRQRIRYSERTSFMHTSIKRTPPPTPIARRERDAVASNSNCRLQPHFRKMSVEQNKDESNFNDAVPETFAKPPKRFPQPQRRNVGCRHYRKTSFTCVMLYTKKPHLDALNVSFTLCIFVNITFLFRKFEIPFRRTCHKSNLCWGRRIVRVRSKHFRC